MITNESLIECIQSFIPDAEVSISDPTGSMDHFSLRVASRRFEGMSLLDRHRMVYKALSEPMKDGRIHAVEIQTKVPDSEA
jgi:stress-induced morphogen